MTTTKRVAALAFWHEIDTCFRGRRELAAENIIAMHTYYVYGDDGQQEIEAPDLLSAAAMVSAGITAAMIAAGGWAVIRDDETMESVLIGEEPRR